MPQKTKGIIIITNNIFAKIEDENFLIEPNILPIIILLLYI